MPDKSRNHKNAVELASWFSGVLGKASLLASMSLASMGALSAQELDVEFEVGAGYSDNLNRAPDSADFPAVSDTVYTVGASLIYEKESARYDANIEAGLFFESFQDSTFANDTLPSLLADVTFNLFKDRLTWVVLDNYGQQISNPFQSLTPDNRNDINFFTTGPRLQQPVGERSALNVKAEFSDVRIENNRSDNQRIGGGLGFERALSSNRSVSINVDGERIKYTEDDVYPQLDRGSAYLSFDTHSAHNDLTIDVGWNQVKRDGVKDDGVLFDFRWNRQASPFLSGQLNIGSRLSTSGDLFRFNQGLDSGRGGAEDVQAVSDPFQNHYVRGVLAFRKNRTMLAARGNFDVEEYQESIELDRLMIGLGLDFTRELSRTISAGVSTDFYKRRYDAPYRIDDNLQYGFVVDWQAGASTALSLRVERVERSANESIYDYDENRVYLAVSYRPNWGRD